MIASAATATGNAAAIAIAIVSGSENVKESVRGSANETGTETGTVIGTRSSSVTAIIATVVTMIEMMIAIVVTTAVTPHRFAVAVVVAVANGAIIVTMIDGEMEVVEVAATTIAETIDAINGAMNTTKIVVEAAVRTPEIPATRVGHASLRKTGDVVDGAHDRGPDRVPDLDRLRRPARSAEPQSYRPLLLHQEAVVVVCYQRPRGSSIRCCPNHSHHCYLRHRQLKSCWEGSALVV